MKQSAKLVVEVTAYNGQLLASIAGFNTGFVDTMNRIGGQWRRGAGGYVFPQGALPKLLSACQKADWDVHTATEITGMAKDMTAAKDLPVTPNRTPYAHQRTGAQYILDNPHALVLDEQGLGKGFEAVLATEARALEWEKDKGERFRTLILAPVSMLYTWVDEICGTPKEPGPFPHRKAYVYNPKVAIPEDCEYLICSWDTLRQTERYEENGEKKKRFKYLKFIAAWAPHQIIGDEIYRIKNHKSDTAKAINELESMFAVGLTGTLIPNKIEDCWFPVSYFRPGALPTRTKFLNRFCHIGNRFSRWAITGYKNLDELADILTSESIRRLRKDVLDMPPRTFAITKFDMTPAQRKLYEKYRDEVIEHIDEDGEVNSMIMLTRIQRLNQIANNPRLADDSFPMITTKYDALVEKIGDMSGQIIVWSNFRETLDYLKEQLGEDAEIIYGGVSAKRRKDIIDAFNRGDIKGFLGMPPACREGITINKGLVMDYMDRSFNLVDRLQSRDRNYRIGQDNPVFLTDYVVPGTVDELTLAVLDDKTQTMEKMTRPTDGEGNVLLSRDIVLQYLGVL